MQRALVGNWKLKVLIQAVLGRLPGGERLNYYLQAAIGSHTPAWPKKRVMQIAGYLAGLSRHVQIDGAVVVEVGTGWDAINPLVLYLFGAKAIHTYDHVRHLRLKLAQNVILQMELSLEEIGACSKIPYEVLRERLQRIKYVTTLAELLAAAHIEYTAPGDAARTGLPEHSVDLFYSYAVFEHVPAEVVDRLTHEARRVLRPGGVAFHHIGLHDHYANVDPAITNVNFLQYPDWAWNLLVQNKISYHNRMRAKEFLAIFNSSGAKILEQQSELDPAALERLKQMRINKRFRGLTHEELAVQLLDVTMAFSSS